MPLQSNLFRSDQKLQACLLHDSAHVTPGSVGDHVSKIQTALIMLDKLDVEASERLAKRYGPSTAAAVLSYKRKRNIINRSYQTQADNIVGKMTIASLDNEMLARERSTTVVAESIRCSIADDSVVT
jgi:peptidoglycan hydrolase-like protein with peptidoglycan-binding domain